MNRFIGRVLSSAVVVVGKAAETAMSLGEASMYAAQSPQLKVLSHEITLHPQWSAEWFASLEKFHAEAARNTDLRFSRYSILWNFGWWLETISYKLTDLQRRLFARRWRDSQWTDTDWVIDLESLPYSDEF